MGPSSELLLSVWLVDADAGAPGPWLKVQALDAPGAQPICLGPVRVAPPGATLLRAPLEIRLPGGELYGRMLPHPSGWSVVHRGTTVLIVNCLQPFPRLHAAAMDGCAVRGNCHDAMRHHLRTHDLTDLYQ